MRHDYSLNFLEDPLSKNQGFKTLFGLLFSLFLFFIIASPLGPTVEGSLTEIVKEISRPTNHWGSSTEYINLVDNSFLVSQIENLPDYTDKILVLVTGYSSTPEETDDDPFVTASGKFVKDGIVAANFLPFGTKIRFPLLYPDKIFIVEDRMHSRFSKNRVDIWFPSKDLALVFGVKETIMEIVE